MADSGVELNHADIIDIFPQYSILTFRLRNPAKIILPEEIVLNSITVCNDSNQPLQYILVPSNRLEAPHKMVPVRVIKDEQVLIGRLIDQHKHRVRILSDSRVFTIFKPDLIEELDPPHPATLGLVSAENEVVLKFRVNTIRMDVNYLVNIEGDRMFIRPRYRIINNDSVDRSYGKISLHRQDVNAFEPGGKLLYVNGDLTSDGMLIDLLDPIEADYQKYYEYVVKTGRTNLICEFIPSEELTSGPAEFYRDNRYSGPGELPFTSKGVIGRIDLGTSKLNVSSVISKEIIDDQNIINITVTVADQLDEKIMIAVIYEAKTDVIPYGSMKPGNVDGRKVTWRIGFGPSTKPQSITMQLRIAMEDTVTRRTVSRSTGKSSIKRT